MSLLNLLIIRAEELNYPGLYDRTFEQEIAFKNEQNHCDKGTQDATTSSSLIVPLFISHKTLIFLVQKQHGTNGQSVGRTDGWTEGCNLL